MRFEHRPPDATDRPSSGAQHSTNETVAAGPDGWEGVCSTLKTIASELVELKSAVSRRHDEPVSNNPSCHGCRHCHCSEASDLGGLSPIAGIHATTGFSGQTVYLGSNSFPALAASISKDKDIGGPIRELFAKDVLPLFGLDNESATYPLVDLWGLPPGSLSRVRKLSKAFPSDADCWIFLKSYKETSHVLFPAVEHLDDLESELLQFLLARRAAQDVDEEGSTITEHTIFGKDLCWVGLLFAILASGSQCSSIPRGERELTSKVYVCCSFECLRITNFLSYSNIATIQTLLIIGNVLSNNVNAGIAWSLLGLTIRLAQTQGLHQERTCPPEAITELDLSRKKIWWCVIWQDSFLSITFDRASSTTADGPIFTESSPGQRSYVECMSRLCKAGLDVISERSQRRKLQDSLTQMAQLRQGIQDIILDGVDYLRDPSKARSRRERLEHASIYLHASYITSELCRPTLNPALANCPLAQPLRAACTDSLVDTVDAFLNLQELTAFTRRAWLAIYRVLSCALLLAILKVPERNARAHSLVERLITVLADASDPTEMSSPVARSLTTLRKLLSLGDRPSCFGQ